MIVKYAILVMFLILFFNSCNKNSEIKIINEHGFIVFDDSKHWKFIPTKSMNVENCISNFQTENLERGIAFDPSSYSDISYIKRTLDTLMIQNLGPEYPASQQLLKITPANVEYEIFEKDIIRNDQLKSLFKRKIEGQNIQFSYDFLPIKIKKIVPMFCLSKKQNDIKECRCDSREDDPNDYLFKICEYIKKRDRFSDLPCRYNIKEIEDDSLDSKAVVKVELTCCYLGDVAFFDKKTNELIRILYGAK